MSHITRNVTRLTAAVTALETCRHQSVIMTVLTKLITFDEFLEGEGYWQRFKKGHLLLICLADVHLLISLATGSLLQPCDISPPTNMMPADFRILQHGEL